MVILHSGLSSHASLTVCEEFPGRNRLISYPAWVTAVLISPDRLHRAISHGMTMLGFSSHYP